MKRFFALFLLAGSLLACTSTLDLSGTWEFTLDPAALVRREGRLMVCCADLDQVTRWPEGRQFYRALLDYMRSPAFAPVTELKPEELTAVCVSSKK